MIRMALLASLLLLMSVSASYAADKIVGAAWEIQFPGKTKDKDVTLKFRATTDGKIYDSGSELIGTWKGDKDKAEMDVTGFKEKQSKFNGKYELTNISKDEKKARWTGKWTPDGGDKSKDVVVNLLKD